MRACKRRMRERQLVETVYLQTLLEIVRTGSFSKAADRLCISQSAASRRIKFMEDQYGHALVDRSGPVVCATPAGALVIAKSEQILEIERGLLAGLLALSTAKRLRFACTTTFGACYLPRVLSAYLARNPDMKDLSFHFDTPERIVQGMQDGTIDVAVVEHCDSFDLPDLPMHPLPADDMIFVSHRESELPASLTHIDELLGNTLFARAEGCCSRTLLEANMRGQGRSIADFSQVIVMDDVQLITTSVAAGQGIAFVSTDLVSTRIADGSLRPHRVAGFQHHRRRSLLLGSAAKNLEKSDFSAILKASVDAAPTVRRPRSIDARLAP